MHLIIELFLAIFTREGRRQVRSYVKGDSFSADTRDTLTRMDMTIEQLAREQGLDPALADAVKSHTAKTVLILSVGGINSRRISIRRSARSRLP